MQNKLTNLFEDKRRLLIFLFIDLLIVGATVTILVRKSAEAPAPSNTVNRSIDVGPMTAYQNDLFKVSFEFPKSWGEARIKSVPRVQYEGGSESAFRSIEKNFHYLVFSHEPRAGAFFSDPDAITSLSSAGIPETGISNISFPVAFFYYPERQSYCVRTSFDSSCSEKSTLNNGKQYVRVVQADQLQALQTLSNYPVTEKDRIDNETISKYFDALYPERKKLSDKRTYHSEAFVRFGEPQDTNSTFFIGYDHEDASLAEATVERIIQSVRKL